MATEGAAAVAAGICRKCEGLRLAPYFCPAGKLTIGYGHVIAPAEREAMQAGITAEMADDLLRSDLAWALREVRALGRDFTDAQAGALASFVFNVGPVAWRGSSIRRLLVAGDFGAAAEQFGRWVYSHGNRLPGLVERRALEKSIFEG